MHPPWRHSFLILLYIGSTFAAPFSDIGFELSLFSSTNPSSNNSSARNTTFPNLPPLRETILYPIPGSTLTLALNLKPEHPIPASELTICLYATSTRVLDHIRHYGDGPLADVDNPFVSDPFPDANCRVGIRSWKVTKPGGEVSCMTYGNVHTVLRGLLEYMLWPDPHYYGNTFTVRFEKNILGAGSVSQAHG